MCPFVCAHQAHADGRVLHAGCDSVLNDPAAEHRRIAEKVTHVRDGVGEHGEVSPISQGVGDGQRGVLPDVLRDRVLRCVDFLLGPRLCQRIEERLRHVDRGSAVAVEQGVEPAAHRFAVLLVDPLHHALPVGDPAQRRIVDQLHGPPDTPPVGAHFDVRCHELVVLLRVESALRADLGKHLIGCGHVLNQFVLPGPRHVPRKIAHGLGQPAVIRDVLRTQLAHAVKSDRLVHEPVPLLKPVCLLQDAFVDHVPGCLPDMRDLL